MKQHEALDILKLGHNVFLTGAAGSGKTYVLNEYVRFLKTHGAGVGITASTGVAATHIGGLTIHSWAGFGIQDTITEKDLKELLKKSYLRKRFNRTSVLVIDEASMLHPFQLDIVDEICKAFKEPFKPFGGMQLVLSGDFFQLPPVSKNEEGVQFINESRSWREMNPHVCYLNEQHRHDDAGLTQILNDVRGGTTGEHTLRTLRRRYKKEPEGNTKPTKLYTHNADVDRINSEHLKKLDGEPHIYTMTSRGNKTLVNFLKKSCLAPEELRLKKDAIVMFVKNKFELGYVNGTLGTVVSFDKVNGHPVVKLPSGKHISASFEDWVIEEEGKVKARISQIPLRLAWAITVHKSQGMTLDAAEIDLSKSFVPGMGYVALSRIRTLGGLKLIGLNHVALQVDKQVCILDRELQEKSSVICEQLNALSSEEKAQAQKEFIESIRSSVEKKPPTLDETKKCIEKQMAVADIARARNLTEGTILAHIEKLLARGDQLNIAYMRPQTKRFEKIKAAFAKSKEIKLSPVKAILGEDYSYDEIRFVRLFLD